MNQGKTVFSQLMELLPLHVFRKCVKRYRGNYKVQQFTCLDQFLCMTFAQLSYRESLRDIEVCLRSMQSKLYHMGIRGKVSRSTLADANDNRNWRIYSDFAHVLIGKARNLYAQDSFGVELGQTAYALDSSTIDLCLSVFPWARFRQNKGAIKLHTLMDLRGNIPVFIQITDGKVHDVNILDNLSPEAGSFYVMDRGYIDFTRLYRFNLNNANFLIRAKSNFNYKRLYSQTVDKSTGLRCDQIIKVAGYYKSKDYPEKLRRIRYYDSETNKRFTFLTNQLTLPALTIAEFYRCRWQIELFFKWIKQHLRIKKFYGTSENAVKTQIWIAISVYVLVAIFKKNLNMDHSLYTILQILSLTLFEKRPIIEIFSETPFQDHKIFDQNQFPLFDLLE
ncbi:MAG: IS4 family transposase [candidate division Zixibacteria bacterium]|nr:IS4 family transposase [candidate division Zixibacteria bacterium]